MRYLIGLFIGMIGATVLAQAAGSGAGERLERKHCIACHDATFYRRADRRIQGEARLLGRIQACNQNLGIGLLPGEERRIADHLLQRDYRSGP